MLTFFTAATWNAATADDPATRHPSMPNTSVVRFEAQLPLAEIARRVDQELPRTTGSPDRFIVHNDSLEIRYAVNRDSVSLEMNGYDFTLTFNTHYWLVVRGRNGYSLDESWCGTPEEPINIATSYRGRFGWADGWKIEMRLEPNANVFALRCKPKPPGVNFTEFLDEQIQQKFHGPAGEAFTREINALDGIRPLIEEAWAALHEPQDLFEKQVWIHWTPVRIEADPLGGMGSTLDFRVSFVTEPSVHVGEPTAFSIAPLPDPVVRLSGSDTRIPVDVALPLAEIGPHIERRLTSTAFAAVKSARVGGSGREITVDVSSPDSPGSVLLAGTVSFHADSAAFQVRDLDWRPGAAERFRAAYPGLDSGAFRDKLRSELGFDVFDELNARRQLIPKALNRRMSPSVSSRGAMSHFLAEDPQVTETSLTIRHWALGPMWLTVTPPFTGGTAPAPRHDSRNR